MTIKKILPKNKKGMSLIELVIGVLVLSIFALGIITALTTANTTISKKARESIVHTEATQILDGVISVISNGTFVDGNGASINFTDAKKNEILGKIGYSMDDLESLTITPGTTYQSYLEPEKTILRGWILELKYKGATVTGYASNTKGVFDRDVTEDDE